MDRDLLEKLKKWRAGIAQKEGVTLFRVFPNKSLEAIATMKPETKDEMLAIKGIKDRKFEKYGEEILAIISDRDEASRLSDDTDQPKKPLSVSAYLDFVNQKIGVLYARIQGEISSVDIRERVVYFSLKDSDDGSLINCLMWKRSYELSGIEFEAGIELIVEGSPDIYKPSGRLSFKVSSAELVGEGALKKAYDKLKKKLDAEGLFSEERKRDIPDLSRKIGLITSGTGAVIHDFLNNLGKFGYQTKFMDSRVEGQAAVPDLMEAIDYFSGEDIDVLVIIRGGGSLESLQAFNNETLVRKIAECPVPVICGIGHDKDVPLASLVADLAVSTPTAAANFLNRTWEEATRELVVLEKDIVHRYEGELKDKIYLLEEMASGLKKYFSKILQEFTALRYKLRENLNRIGFIIKNVAKVVDHHSSAIFRNFNLVVKDTKKVLSDSFPSILRNLNLIIKNTAKNLDNSLASLLDNFEESLGYKINFLDDAEKRLMISDPLRQLKLGYSIVSVGGKVVKSVEQVSVGDSVDIQVSDGKIKSIINKN